MPDASLLSGDGMLSPDGLPATVVRANGRDRAVAIPAGRHDVRQWYEPPGLRLGLTLTVAAVVALLGLLSWDRLRSSRAAARAEG